jgi:hypothetical protein
MSLFNRDIHFLQITVVCILRTPVFQSQKEQ